MGRLRKTFLSLQVALNRLFVFIISSALFEDFFFKNEFEPPSGREYYKLFDFSFYPNEITVVLLL